MSMYTHICKNLCALQIAFALVADRIWLQIAFGYRLNLIADCIWLQIAFGYRLHLVTDCIWLHIAFGYF